MSSPSLIFPPRFALGDTVGLCAPASPPDQPEVVDETIARLSEFGFRIKAGKFLRQRDSYLAGTDEERAADLHALFADPEVKAIFALRGGYGSCRLLPLLDYELIRANPKPFIGYSDITAMHLAILAKSRLVTFHGSNASSAFQPENRAIFSSMFLTEVAAAVPTGGPQTLFSRETHGASLKTVTPGYASGRLLGGNFTCLLRLLGTPYAPDFRDSILFLEDTGEKAYRVDGMFTHLRLAGILPQIRGLVLGQFDHPDAAEQARIAACLQREGERLGIPCVSGAPIGHFAGQIIVPQGALAELDAVRCELKWVHDSN
jgi:muramoyltetrapeptide carboxypeptidase